MKPQGLFITGTDTGVGKTHVAALIVRALRNEGHRVGAYKPVCSGADFDANGQPTWDDIERLAAALGDNTSRERICPQRFLAPLAPPLAAAAEGRDVDEPLLFAGFQAWSSSADLVVVEGAGGWFCPLTTDSTMADLAKTLDLPVLIVARNRLGVINHTLLTIAAIRSAALPLAGVILNRATAEDADASMIHNAREITRRGNVACLGELAFGSVELLQDGNPVRIAWDLLMCGVEGQHAV